jgi:energy-coupling factor transporter transmembrane protein EcfT
MRLVQEMYLAKRSRTIQLTKNRIQLKGEQKWVAARIGFLFRKSFMMIDEIQLAMIARGFNGEIKLLSSFKLHQRDLGLSLVMILLLFGLIWINIGM